MVKYTVLTALALSLIFNLWFVVNNLSWWIAPAILAGWYLADMASGLVHMYMDYRPCITGVGLDRLYFYEGSRESVEYQTMFRNAMQRINPIERLVYDFKNHHPRPDALGRRKLWRLIGSSVVVATLPLSIMINIACLLLPMAVGVTVPGWLVMGSITLITGGTFAQYFHGSLHRTDNPWMVGVMRRMGLLMTPTAHQLHHNTLKRDFSTNCGWSNPLLNRLFLLAYGRHWLKDDGLEPVG